MINKREARDVKRCLGYCLYGLGRGFGAVAYALVLVTYGCVLVTERLDKAARSLGVERY